MSYSDRDLVAEIAELVERRYRREQRIAANDVTLQIIAEHIPEFAQGASFACHCAWHTTRKAVGSYLARHFRDGEGNVRQLRFPGYEHLQTAYLIGSDAEPVVVPLAQLTAAELLQIATRLEREGKAKLAHARDVRRYLRANFPAAQEAA